MTATNVGMNTPIGGFGYGMKSNALKRNLIQALSDPNCTPATRASYLGLVKHYKHDKLLTEVLKQK
jgi:hypothetical protein